MATMFRHTSLTKGVSYDKRSQRWIGRFTLNGQRHYIGSFKEEAEAALAVNQARINIISSYSLRHEVKELLQEEKDQIDTHAQWMSPVQEWNTFTLSQLKNIAKKRGIIPDEIFGDKRIKQNWIDALTVQDVRPITNKEPEIAQAIAEIDDIIDYLDEDEEEERKFTDKAVLDIHEEDWSPCVIVDPNEPSYYWCSGGFLYTLYPTEGYTVWRYDNTITGNYKPIGVWNGDENNGQDQVDTLWEVAIDKNLGTYCMISRSDELEEGEILENWAEDAVISSPLSENRNLGFALGKSAKP